MKTITEVAKEIPVTHDVDVVVAGGGTAGVAAAICAGRLGLKTLMIDRTSQPGGMLTHVTSWSNDFSNKGGFCKEFFDYLIAENIFDTNWYCYNPYQLLPYLEGLLKESNIDILYLTQVVAPIQDSNDLKGVIVESKQGRHAVLAKVVIDSTGDGDIAARAGADFEYGRDSDRQTQSISTTQYLNNWHAGNVPTEDIQKKINETINKDYKLQYNYGVFMNVVNSKHGMFNNNPHVTGLNPLKADELTKALILLREQAYELFNYLKQIPETADLELGPFSAIPGIRESRRIVCDYMVTDDDAYTGANFDDGIFTVTQPVDIHKCLPDEPPILIKHIKPYHIPFRSMLPKGLNNIMVAGRCIGGSHEALASYRIIADCFGMGEAAAIAANLAIQQHCSVRELDSKQIVSEMKQRQYSI